MRWTRGPACGTECHGPASPPAAQAMCLGLSRTEPGLSLSPSSSLCSLAQLHPTLGPCLPLLPPSGPGCPEDSRPSEGSGFEAFRPFPRLGEAGCGREAGKPELGSRGWARGAGAGPWGLRAWPVLRTLKPRGRAEVCGQTWGWGASTQNVSVVEPRGASPVPGSGCVVGRIPAQPLPAVARGTVPHPLSLRLPCRQ